MFRAAQFIVRNKFVVIGAGALAFLLFGRGEEVKPASPWASDAVQQASAVNRESLVDKAVGAAAGAAKTYAGVDLKADLHKQTVSNWQQTGDAARRANGN